MVASFPPSVDAPARPPIKSGYYRAVGTGADGGTGQWTNRALWVPWTWVETEQTFSEIGIEVTGAPNATAAIRFGLYEDGGDFSPVDAPQLEDFGSVAVDTIGFKKKDIDLTVEPALYWVVVQFEGTGPTVRRVTPLSCDVQSSTATGVQGLFGYDVAPSPGGYPPGSLPDPGVTDYPGTFSANYPRVIVKAA